jgi:hypothetical protein
MLLGRGEAYTGFVRKLRDRHHFEDLRLDVSLILEWIFMK